jgi:hypothetical protein
MVELVDLNDVRAVRNKNNILALYDLMINKKDAKKAVTEFFASECVQHNPLVPPRMQTACSDCVSERGYSLGRLASISCVTAAVLPTA